MLYLQNLRLTLLYSWLLFLVFPLGVLILWLVRIDGLVALRYGLSQRWEGLERRPFALDCVFCLLSFRRAVLALLLLCPLPRLGSLV